MKRADTLEDLKSRLRNELPGLRETYGVEKVALFGSHVEGTQTVDSDVDLLVELHRPLGLRFVRLADHLEQILGRRVDLATFEALNRALSDQRRKHIAAEVMRHLTYV